MAELVLLADPKGSLEYEFLRSGDEYPVPDVVFQTLRAAPYHADYVHGRKGELRLRAAVVPDVLAFLAAEGHHVRRIAATRADVRRRTGARGPLECAQPGCAAAYPVGSIIGPDQRCRSCGQPLELIPPHACGTDCGPECAP